MWVTAAHPNHRKDDADRTKGCLRRCDVHDLLGEIKPLDGGAQGRVQVVLVIGPLKSRTSLHWYQYELGVGDSGEERRNEANTLIACFTSGLWLIKDQFSQTEALAKIINVLPGMGSLTCTIFCSGMHTTPRLTVSSELLEDESTMLSDTKYVWDS